MGVLLTLVTFEPTVFDLSSPYQGLLIYPSFPCLFLISIFYFPFPQISVASNGQRAGWRATSTGAAMCGQTFLYVQHCFLSA